MEGEEGIEKRKKGEQRRTRVMTALEGANHHAEQQLCWVDARPMLMCKLVSSRMDVKSFMLNV